MSCGVINQTEEICCLVLTLWQKQNLSRPFLVLLLTFLRSTACRLPMFESSAAMATPAMAARASRAVVVLAIVVNWVILVPRQSNLPFEGFRSSLPLSWLGRHLVITGGRSRTTGKVWTAPEVVVCLWRGRALRCSSSSTSVYKHLNIYHTQGWILLLLTKESYLLTASFTKRDAHCANGMVGIVEYSAQVNTTAAREEH